MFRKYWNPASFILQMFLLAFLTGCGQVNISWREEVQLADGEVVVVHRTARGKKGGPIGGPEGWASSEMSLDLSSPKSKLEMPQWRFPHVPILLDRDPNTSEWYVVATISSCDGWYSLGSPKLPYTEYKARNGAWQQVPLDENLVDRQGNLLANVDASGYWNLVTLQEKKDWNKRSELRFVQIVGVWKASC